MDKVNSAVDVFNNGFNCSQAVFSSFSEELGLNRDTALKISCGFGGGMREGEVCGCVTGALMALGLKYGQYKSDDKEAKEFTYSLVKEFNKRFREKNGSILCRELLGCDISTDEGRKLAKEQGLFNSLCPKFIDDAVSILEDML